MNVDLGRGEQLTDLQFNGLKIIQREGIFRFGTDSVLLSWYARVKRGDRVVDFCTGTGVIPVLLYSRQPDADYTGVDIDGEVCCIARRSVALNGLDDKISIVRGDITDIRSCVSGVCDVVTANPPYDTVDSGELGGEARARHEVSLDIGGVTAGASRLLKPKGRFYVVFRPSRLAALLCAMCGSNIEPKRMRFVIPKPGRAPWCVLVEGMKMGKPGLNVEPTLCLCGEDGEYTDEARSIYRID